MGAPNVHDHQAAEEEVKVERQSSSRASRIVLTELHLARYQRPEILLAVSEVCAKLGEPAGELGPSTIVGSAAFNLLFISAVCIPAVTEPTKIDDLGVFIITSIFSLFAYIWMFICLKVTTPGYVTTTEAYITLGFFLLLLIMAYSGDRFRAR